MYSMCWVIHVTSFALLHWCGALRLLLQLRRWSAAASAPSVILRARGHKYKLFKPRCTASIRQKFFVDRVINVWNALPPTVNFTYLNVLGLVLKILIFLVCFRAAVSVLVGPCCPALLNCIDVDVHTVMWANKMTMMKYLSLPKPADRPPAWVGLSIASVCLSIRVLKGKRLELSVPKSVDALAVFRNWR